MKLLYDSQGIQMYHLNSFIAQKNEAHHSFIHQPRRLTCGLFINLPMSQELLNWWFKMKLAADTFLPESFVQAGRLMIAAHWC